MNHHIDRNRGILPVGEPDSNENQNSTDVATDEELRELAEDIVRYCPSLTHLLLAMGSPNQSNPLRDLN